MLMIQNIKIYWRFPVRALVSGLLLLGAVLLVACSDDRDTQTAGTPQPTQDAPNATDGESSTPSEPSIHVVGTTNFVADWARVVGGDNVEVFGLLPAGGDPHTFIPGTQDIAKVADSDIVFTVGLGLEGDWIGDLLHNASADESKIVSLGDRVNPIESAVGMHGHHEDEHDDDHEGEGDDDHDGHEGHDHGPLDPHFWFDPPRVKAAVAGIAARFAAIDPDNAATYFQNAADYAEQLDELHSWTLEQVSTVAPERRLLVTSHDSLSYFAELYGFEIVGLVIPSLATHVEPSADHIADVVDVVRDHNVPAVFGETTVSERLAQAVALETGAELVQLYSGSLGPAGSGAETYLGMVRTNVERIVGALR